MPILLLFSSRKVAALRPLLNQRPRQMTILMTLSSWQGKGLPHPARIPSMPGKTRISLTLTSYSQEPETHKGLQVTQRCATYHLEQAGLPCQSLATGHVRHQSADCSPAIYFNTSSNIIPNCRIHRSIIATDLAPNDPYFRSTLFISVHDSAGFRHSLLRSTVAAISP